MNTGLSDVKTRVVLFGYFERADRVGHSKRGDKRPAKSDSDQKMTKATSSPLNRTSYLESGLKRTLTALSNSTLVRMYLEAHEASEPTRTANHMRQLLLLLLLLFQLFGCPHEQGSVWKKSRNQKNRLDL